MFRFFVKLLMCSFPCHPLAPSRLFYVPAAVVYKLCMLRGQLLSWNITLNTSCELLHLLLCYL